MLEPIFEADFKPCSYGFRPNRRAQDAIAEIHYFVSSPSHIPWHWRPISKHVLTKLSIIP